MDDEAVGDRALAERPLQETGGVAMGLMVVVAGYLLGSVLPAVWFVKRRTGKAPLELGDNPGGAGVWRQAGPGPAVVTTVFDLAKGILPLAAAERLGIGGYWLAAAACAPVVGHSWSVFNGFKGGKGLAASTGALLYLSWREMLPAYALGAVVGLWKKWVPAVGIVALPVGLGLMLAHSVDPERVLIALSIVVLLVLRQVPWVVTNLLKRGQRPGWPPA